MWGGGGGGGGGGCAFIISLIIDCNNFSSKLFSELKYGIAYVISIRPSYIHPCARYFS